MNQYCRNMLEAKQQFQFFSVQFVDANFEEKHLKFISSTAKHNLR